MKKLALALLGLTLVLAPLAPQGFAQKKKEKEDLTVRSVSGQVTDDSGAPISGAVVHLKNTKTLQIRSFITKDDGSYVFHGLSTTVDYELKAEHQGASSDSKTLSVFDSRNKAVINLKLKKA
jgi:hypothetical protein